MVVSKIIHIYEDQGPPIIFVIETFPYCPRVFFQIFLKLEEISARSMKSIIIGVVTHIIGSPNDEQVTNENIKRSEPSIKPCGTSL